MSIAVALDDLRARTAEYGDAYVLTVRDDQRPHVVLARPEWDGDHLVMALGRGSTANAAARPSIALCYPPPDAGGYSLIVDGTATVTDDVVRFAPTGAVLHRPARGDAASSSSAGEAGSAGGCAADCAPVTAD